MDAHAALTSRRPSCAEGVLAALLGAWLLWALLATALTGRTIGDGVEYAALPMVLGVGLVLGWLCARWAGGFVLSAATTALALTVLVTPFYANAQAAVGVQLVALSGLLLSTALAGRPVASRGGKRKRSTTAAVVLPVLTGVLGVLLAARAEAASILVVAVAALVALALALAVPVGVSRVVGVASIGIGLVGVAGALVVVIVLARLPVWPQWLEEDDSLSWARQLLWRDALELWGASGGRCRPRLVRRALRGRTLRAAPVRRPLLGPAGGGRARRRRRRAVPGGAGRGGVGRRTG